MHRVEQKDVAVRSQTAVAMKKVCIGRGKQRLACCNRSSISLGDRGQGLKVQRIADVLEPPEPKGCQSRGRLETRCSIVGVDRIDREVAGIRQQSRRRFDAPQILLKWNAADFDL